MSKKISLDFAKSKALSSTLLDNDPELLTRIVEYEIRSFFEFAQHGGERPHDREGITLDSFSDNPLTLEQLGKLITDEILGRAVYKARPEYMSFIDNGTNTANIVAAPLISLMQQNMTTHITDSPGATMNELSLIMEMRRLAGYPYVEKPKSLLEIGGNFVSGGMMGNMEAILVARNQLYPDAQKRGIHGYKPPKIILPYFASHYSLWNAFGWMGFGEDNIAFVDTKDFRYQIDKLEETIETIKEEGHPILMAVASLGDSFSLSVENVKAVHNLCKKHNIWLHGDGANGGNLIFSHKHREVIDGIHLCDSITLDPHKAMGLNYPCSVFLCKDTQAFNSLISHWNIVNRPDSLDLGMITPFLNSRGFDSLRLWLALKLFGLKGFANTLDRKIDTTKQIYTDLKSLGTSVFLWNEPQALSLLFQIVPPSLAPLHPPRLDSDGRNALSQYQEDFKRFLEERTGIKLHSFGLPVSVLSGNSAEHGSFTTVLALHNGHESVPDELRANLKNTIREYTSGAQDQIFAQHLASNKLQL